MTQPPIVPGEEPPRYQPPYYPPPQQPVYYVQHPPSDVAGKAMTGTIVVLGTLFLIFCVAPIVTCAFLGGLGQLFGS